jgi:SPP1 family predicted phage head-tail adaptor
VPTDGLGAYRHVVSFQTLTSAPDGDGGIVETWIDLDPATWNVAIRPATVRDLERSAAGAIVATATHVISGFYRGDVTVDARMLFNGREFRIVGVRNVEERSITMDLFALETVQ